MAVNITERTEKYLIMTLVTQKWSPGIWNQIYLNSTNAAVSFNLSVPEHLVHTSITALTTLYHNGGLFFFSSNDLGYVFKGRVSNSSPSPPDYLVPNCNSNKSTTSKSSSMLVFKYNYE